MKKIILTSNIIWVIAQFRKDLIKHLKNDYEIICVAGNDEFSDEKIKILYLKRYFEMYKYIQALNQNPVQFQMELDEIEKQLLQGNVVSIHVRGGDYITSKKDNILFGNICTKKYYKNAIEYMQNSVKDPIYLILTNNKNYTVQLCNWIKVDS